MSDVDNRLKHLRPVGPPDGLRSRVIGAIDRRRRRSREWLLPLAAAAAIVVLYVLAGRARAAALGEVSADPVATATVQQITEQLGGGPLARYFAARLVRSELAEEDRVE